MLSTLTKVVGIASQSLEEWELESGRHFWAGSTYFRDKLRSHGAASSPPVRTLDIARPVVLLAQGIAMADRDVQWDCL